MSFTTWEEVRTYRDWLLSNSDWMMLTDSPVNKEAAEAYRAALRGIPQVFETPESVVWPELPL